MDTEVRLTTSTKAMVVKKPDTTLRKPNMTSAPKRAIVGFHQDDEGHWVAELECGHSQHMRHEPPWQNRAWVLTPEGRAGFIGVRIKCRPCAE